MAKGRSRWYPEKRANLQGHWCSCCEDIDGKLQCEVGVPNHIVESVCKGNAHNCCKVVYRKWAGKSEKDGLPQVNNKWDS